MARKPLSLFIASAALLALSSWLKFFATSSLMVDDNPVENRSSFLLLTGMFLLSVALGGYAYWKTIFRAPGFDLSPAQTKRLAQIIAVVAGFMLPMLSNDFSIYLAHGNLLGKGIFTYANGTKLRFSDFYPYVSYHWKECPNFYGPPLLMLFYLSTLIGGKSLFASWMIYKLFNTVFFLFYIRLAEKYCANNTNGKYNTLAVLTLAPIVYIQAAGQAHVDTIILTLTLLVLYLLKQHKTLMAALATSVIVTCKVLLAAVFLPFFFVALYFMHRDALKKFYILFLKCCAIIISVIVVSYSYFWEGFSTITVPIQYHYNKSPANSFTSVLTDFAVYLTPSASQDERNQKGVDNPDGGKPQIFHRLRERGNEEKNIENLRWSYRSIFTPCFALFGLLLAAFNFIALVGAKRLEDVIYVFGKILVITVCFFSSIFHPWYLLLPLPFLADSNKKSWMIWLAIVPAIASLHEIKFIIPHTAMLFPFAELLLLPALALFFLFFRRHFIIEPYELLKPVFGIK